jgi:hypothetical protein
MTFLQDFRKILILNNPIYMIEIFTKKIKEKYRENITIVNDQFKEYLASISGGSIHTTYDHDSHYVINMRLTFDILKKLNDIDFILEVCGVGNSIQNCWLS